MGDDETDGGGIYHWANKSYLMTVLSTADEGKVLMDITGSEFGVVTEVDPEEQVAYVDPEPGLANAIIQGLGYGGSGDDDIRVPAKSIATVTDTELRVDGILGADE